MTKNAFEKIKAGLEDALATTRHEIITDGKTVWVNGPFGECLGRFSNLAYEVLRTMEEQERGMPPLRMTITRESSIHDWFKFCGAVMLHHRINVFTSPPPRYLTVDA